MKAKTAMWRSGDGTSSPIRDLETGHLQNLAAYLSRREAEHVRIMEMAEQRGLMIGPLLVQEEPIVSWIICIMNELARRRTRELEKAQKSLNMLKVEPAL